MIPFFFRCVKNPLPIIERYLVNRKENQNEET